MLALNVCRVPNVWHTVKKKALPCASLCRVFFHKSTVNERFLPGVKSLLCVFLRGTRQMSSLPCAISFPCAAVRAHGKGPLCRVPEIQHTAKPKAHGKYAQSGSEPRPHPYEIISLHFDSRQTPNASPPFCSPPTARPSFSPPSNAHYVPLATHKLQWRVAH